MENIKELEGFNNLCNELVNGKYLLAEVKISSLLNLISNDEKLTNIVNSCVQNYDYNSQSTLILKNEEPNPYVELPQNDNEIIAFVYNLLYKIKSGSIDLNKFLLNYFSDTSTNGKEFINFVIQLIIPFKNSINNIYSKRHIIVESSEYQSNFYNKIMSIVKLTLKNVDAYKLNMNQKEEFTLLLNSLYLASEKNDKKLVFSLMVGLDYFTKVHKKTRSAYLSLEECFEK